MLLEPWGEGASLEEVLAAVAGYPAERKAPYAAPGQASSRRGGGTTQLRGERGGKGPLGRAMSGEAAASSQARALRAWLPPMCSPPPVQTFKIVVECWGRKMAVPEQVGSASEQVWALCVLDHPVCTTPPPTPPTHQVAIIERFHAPTGLKGRVDLHAPTHTFWVLCCEGRSDVPGMPTLPRRCAWERSTHVRAAPRVDERGGRCAHADVLVSCAAHPRLLRPLAGTTLGGRWGWVTAR